MSRAANTRHRYVEESSPSDANLAHAAGCFSGDESIARECAQRGYFMSFAGNVTYPRNEHLRRAALEVPRDRLLVETDSPFLAPQSLRGRDNEPANVMRTLEEIARVRDEDVDALVETTTSNAHAAFPDLR